MAESRILNTFKDIFGSLNPFANKPNEQAAPQPEAPMMPPVQPMSLQQQGKERDPFELSPWQRPQPQPPAGRRRPRRIGGKQAPATTPPVVMPQPTGATPAPYGEELGDNPDVTPGAPPSVPNPQILPEQARVNQQNETLIGNLLRYSLPTRPGAAAEDAATLQNAATPAEPSTVDKNFGATAPYADARMAYSVVPPPNYGQNPETPQISSVLLPIHATGAGAVTAGTGNNLMPAGSDGKGTPPGTAVVPTTTTPKPERWFTYVTKQGPQRVKVVDGNVVGEQGQPVTTLYEALKNPTFLRDYRLQDVESRLQEAYKANAPTSTIASLNRERAEVLRDYATNPEPDRKRDWKDILRGIALGGLRGMATGNFGLAIGGALGGGIGSAINPNTDDVMWNEMHTLPKAQAAYEAASENEKSAFAADKARDESEFKKLERLGKLQDIEGSGFENVRKAAEAREAIIKGVVGEDKGPLTPQQIQLIDARLKEHGLGPSGLQPYQSRGEQGTIYTDKTRGVVGRMFSNGMFLEAYTIDPANGKRVPMTDLPNQTVAVYGTDGVFYGYMSSKEFTEKRMAQDFTAYTAQTRESEQEIKVQEGVINDGTARITKINEEVLKLGTTIRTKETEMANNTQEIARITDRIRTLTTGSDGEVTADGDLDPSTQREVFSLRGRITELTNKNALLDPEIRQAKAEQIRLYGERDTLQTSVNNAQQTLGRLRQAPRAGQQTQQGDTPKLTIDQEFDANGIGKGSVTSNQLTYTGGLKKGTDGKIVANGKGQLTFPSGASYVGDFVDDKFHGQGTYTLADGGKYVGQFKNDAFDGMGVRTWPEGRRYEGQFKNDKPNGQGTMTWRNETYTGEFLNGNRNGRGIYTYPNGDRYEAIWKDGAPVSGKVVYANGDMYAGEFNANGQFEGRGEYTRKNGERIVGTFKNGNLVK